MRFVRWVGVLAVLAALAGAGWYNYWDRTDETPIYRTGKVQKRSVALHVSASGTLRAVVTVTVGSQVSGQIQELLADFNSEVRKHDVIARLDPALFKAKVRQAEAELSIANANVLIQKASLTEFEADHAGALAGLLEAKADLSRKQGLLARRVIAESQVEKATAEKDRAQALVNAAKAKRTRQQAQILNAHAQVRQKEAALQQTELDLEHTIIRSPVDGMVISRDVDIGQTVAASLQAPVLFTIAKDLRNMQVEVSVDEADIGQIIDGQNAKFTVDSYVGRIFSGVVTQIRKAPITVSNVVTYVVVVSTKNDKFQLLPGMTANVLFVVDERIDALTVPNAALRFRPDSVAGKRVRRTSRSGQIWVPGADGAAVPVAVRYGISDGTVSEIVSGDLAEGQAVIIGIDRQAMLSARRRFDLSSLKIFK